MMASAQVVKTSVNTNNSPSQDYTTNLDDHSNYNNIEFAVESISNAINDIGGCAVEMVVYLI